MKNEAATSSNQNYRWNGSINEERRENQNGFQRFVRNETEGSSARKIKYRKLQREEREMVEREREFGNQREGLKV